MSAVSSRSGRVVNALARAAFAGAGLACAELALAQSARDDLFAPGEFARYALAAVGVAASLSLLATALLAGLRGLAARGAVDAESAQRRLWVAVFALVAPTTDLVLWLLTSGRRVRALPGRALLVALTAGAVALGVGFLASRWLAWRRSGAPRARALVACGLVVAAVGCLAVDQRVLPRGYQSFHWALAAFAVLAGAVAADLASLHGALGRRTSLVVSALGVVGALSAIPALWALRVAPNARYAAERVAPLTGKAVASLRRLTPQPVPTLRSPIARPVVADDGGVSRDAGEARALALVDQSVLLVTVDALRADRLEAYGGHGLTPALDALARESVVFRRAYTPTPQTSYALGSLFSGTYLRAVLTLPGAGATRPTLASLLRQAGFHTAAFYPPAVFFVDGEQLGALRTEGFGFEQHTVGSATAAERAQQVERWLAATPDAEPVFVWAHVFEPHEPYEPPAAFARGDSDVERYDGEVAAADAGVGALVRAFRARRPRGTVIVTADHGEEFGEHGGHYHGTTLYDEQARVPLLWSSPGATRARPVDAPVELLDLAPTLLAALGVPPDARMRGDDLGALLSGADTPTPAYAFSSIAEEWMVTDGHLKAICAEGQGDCRLYDLASDPTERRDQSEARPSDAARLRGALAGLISSIPRVETADDVRAPLARARLGDPSAGPAVLPLLGSSDAALRAEAAGALASLRFVASLPTLERLRRTDVDAVVRDEAAIASFVLGDQAARADLARIATQAVAGDAPDAGRVAPAALDRTRRAALALAVSDDATGAKALLDLAADGSARPAPRVVAIRALGRFRVRGARPVLESLLSDLVLRAVAAEALGDLGDRRAGDALVLALAAERYWGARVAEARALVVLRDRRAVPLIRAQLGAAQPLPDGVALLLQAGELSRPSGAGADLRRSASVRRGAWRCTGSAPRSDDSGCAPVEAAQLALPRAGAPPGPVRVVVRVLVGEPTLGDAAPATLALGVDAPARALSPGAHEAVLELADSAQLGALSVTSTGDVRLVAVAVVSTRGSAPLR